MDAPTSKAKPPAGNNDAATLARYDLFIEAYLSNGGNATQAAISAGYAKGAARQQGSSVLSRPYVRQKIDERRAELQAQAREQTSLTVERVIKSLARAVLFDPRKLVWQEGEVYLGAPVPRSRVGKLKMPHELDDDTALTISGFKVDINAKGKVTHIEYKATQRDVARDQALKHLGLFKEDNEQPGAAVADAILKIGALEPLRDKFARVLTLVPNAKAA